MLSALIDSRSRWLVAHRTPRTLCFCSIQLAKKISRSASPPRENLGLLVASSRGNSICPSNPRIPRWRSGLPLMKPLEKQSCQAGSSALCPGQNIQPPLRDPDNFPSVRMTRHIAGLAQFSFRNGRRIRQQRIQQRGLTRAVPAHQGDFPPRTILAVKLRITSVVFVRLVTPSSSRMCFPEGRFCSNFR